MAQKQINFHAYRVSYSNKKMKQMEATLNKLASAPLMQRVLQLSGQTYRLDEISKGTIGSFPYISLEFSKFRLDGPSISEIGKPTISAKSDPKMLFSEQCCALYIPSKEIIIIQYNHIGIRADSIANFISNFSSGNTFSFSLLLNQKAIKRLKKFNTFTSIKMDVREINSNTTLSQQSAKGTGFIAGMINCIDAAGGYKGVFEFRGKKTGPDKIHLTKQDVNDIINFSSLAGNSFEQFIISGVEKTEDRIDQVNLLKEKLTHTVKLKIDPLSGRVDFNDRIKSAKQAFDSWESKKYI